MSEIINAQVVEPASTGLSRVVRWIVKLLLGGLLIVALIYTMRLFLLWFQFGSAEDLIGNNPVLPSGVQKSFTLGLMIAQYLLLLPVVVVLLKPWSNALPAFLGLTVFGFLQYSVPTVLEYATRPQPIAPSQLLDRRLFDSKGKGLVWYASGQSCYEVFDAPGVHPLTREKLQPISPAAAKVLMSCLQEQKQRQQLEAENANRQQKGLLPEQIVVWNRDLAFFNPVTGEPLIWGAPNGDCYDLFRNGKDGFHPQTGVRLFPITKVLVGKVIKCKEGEAMRQQELLRQQQTEAPAPTVQPDLANASADTSVEPKQVPRLPKATLIVTNNDCRPYSLFLNDQHYGDIPANGATQTFQVKPDFYSARICLAGQALKCSDAMGEHLGPGSNVSRTIKRSERCSQS
jgi:hypothetical protein